MLNYKPFVETVGKLALYIGSTLSLFGLVNGCASKYSEYNGPTHVEGKENEYDWVEALKRGDPDIRELTEEEMKKIRGAPMNPSLDDRLDPDVLRLILRSRIPQRLPDACHLPRLRDQVCQHRR